MTQSGPLRVLIIEDNDDDAILLRRVLRQAEIDAAIEVATGLSSATELLDHGAFDIVLSDYNLPETVFADVLALVRQHDPDLPVIVVTGSVGEELAVELMRLGANDLVLKQNFSRLPLAVQREVGAAVERRARRESDRRYRDIVLSMADWVWEIDADYRLCFDQSGRDHSEWSDPLRQAGRTHWAAVGADPDRDPSWREYRRKLEAREPFRNFRYCFNSPSGQEYHVSMSGTPVFGADGAFLGYRGTATDETLVVDTFMRAENAEAELEALSKTRA